MKLPNKVYHYLGFYIAWTCFFLAIFNIETTVYCTLLMISSIFNFLAALVHCNRDNINFLYKEIRKEKEDD